VYSLGFWSVLMTASHQFVYRKQAWPISLTKYRLPSIRI
jgi:hypothetical protein